MLRLFGFYSLLPSGFSNHKNVFIYLFKKKRFLCLLMLKYDAFHSGVIHLNAQSSCCTTHVSQGVI